MNLSELLGQRIKQARKRLSISQEQLGEMVSRDQQTISDYESGKRRILAVDLPNLARTLNVPIIYFFDGELNEDDLDRALLEDFRRLPTFEYKKTIIKVVHDLSETILLHSK